MKSFLGHARALAVAASLANLAALGVAAPLAAGSQDAKAFAAVCRSKSAASERAGTSTVAGRDGWLFFAPELKHLGAGRFWGETAARADPLPAILDFKAQLARAGIELLLVPVPPKAIIFPDKLDARFASRNSAPPRLDSEDSEFHSLLRRNGVAVLDLAPLFLERDGDADPVYCKQDTHWSGRGCVLAARAIASAVSDRPWLSAAPKIKTSQMWKRVAFKGDLQPESGTRRESIPLRFVGKALAATPSTCGTSFAPPEPIAPDRGSPILLLGDSHNLIFHAGGDMHASGAGLPDQLAAELGLAVDVIAVRGSGATPARLNLLRRARSDSKYLGHLKLVVWCFSAREFTQSTGWQKLPIVP